MKRWTLRVAFAIALGLLTGCAALHEKQGEWIFQPTDRTWGGYGAADGMQDTWIEFDSQRTGVRTRLHGLWMAAEPRPGVRPQPLLVVHGSEDRLIKPELGRRLYEAARGPEAFVLVEGGSHHNTNSVGQAQYRTAIAELFGLRLH